MSELARFALKLRFSGSSVDKNGLDLYDGSTSFYGFSQALQIAFHAYMTDEIVSRATALRGAEMYFSSPRRGSVLFDVIAIVEKYPATFGLGGAIFYDFMKTAFSKAAGYLDKKPETPTVARLATNDTFFDQLAETLEGSLQRGHRAIDHGVRQVTLERSRSELVVFNHRTSQWVNTRDENPNVEEFTGHVTRYNSISGNGRAFIKQIGKVVPFRPGDDFPDNKRGLLTWSLHGSTVATQKGLRIWASKIESAHGDTKRLILADCAVKKASPA